MGERRADGVVIASTSASSAEAAASEIAAAIKGRLAASGEKSEEALAGLVCFVCASYDAARFSVEIRSALPGAPIFGCTTAGELTPAGWASHSIVAIGFLRRHFTLVAHMMEDLSHFGVEEGRASVAEARAALLAAGPDIEPDHCFGLLLIDGMCRREEAVISALYSALDDIPVVGGSAGDGMSFDKTWMIRDGEAFRDAALLLLFHTDLPFAPDSRPALDQCLGDREWDGGRQLEGVWRLVSTKWRGVEPAGFHQWLDELDHNGRTSGRHQYHQGLCAGLGREFLNNQPREFHVKQCVHAATRLCVSTTAGEQRPELCAANFSRAQRTCPGFDRPGELDNADGFHRHKCHD